MANSARDSHWMAMAIQYAKKGRTTTTPNPNVGCVIVKDGELVGYGYHQKAGEPHAEVYALEKAGTLSQGATAYVTLEPCSHTGKTPPCALALIKAKVARVVCAMTDPNPQVAGKGIKCLEENGIEVEVGVLHEEAERLNRGFLKRMRTQRPFVQVKMASSLDGGTAMSNGESQWITGPEARQDVQHYRAQACAIVTGVGTVLKDNPSLNVRLEGAQRQPDRVVLDSSLQSPLTAQMFSIPGQTIMVHSSRDSERIAEYQKLGVELVYLPKGRNQSGVSLEEFMIWAGQRYNHLWVEAGALLAGAFITEHYADEVVLYQAPIFLGATAKPVIQENITNLADKLQFTVLDHRFVGKDVRWVLQP